MRNLAVVMCMLFVAGLILGVVNPAVAAGKTHQVKATVVSIDTEHNQITIKDEKGEEKTAPVMDQAVAELKNLKTGDKVTLTCHDNDKGEHEGVTAIKKG